MRPAAHDGRLGRHLCRRQAHPRGTGCFARYLGHHVRNGDWTLEEAVQKCSYRPATRPQGPGSASRGDGGGRGGRPGEAISDRSTYDNGKALAVGVEHVLVNGVPVLLNGEREPRPAGASARLTPTSPPATLPHRASTQHPKGRERRAVAQEPHAPIRECRVRSGGGTAVGEAGPAHQREAEFAPRHRSGGTAGKPGRGGGGGSTACRPCSRPLRRPPRARARSAREAEPTK